EVARVLFGIERANEGTLFLKGREVSITSSKAAMRHGIAYVPEDRHRHGLIMDFTIARNMTLPLLSRLTRLGLVDQRREKELANRYAEQLQVRSAGLDQLVRVLSGGNQQKVVLGKWLATKPDILILDEPTRGIDIGAKAEVHRIISELAARG